MTMWFTSDWHLGHRNIIDHCSRPFKSIGRMDQQIIETCISQVKKGDTVHYLGDFAWNGFFYRDILPSLPGTWIFVMGNHDKKFRKFLRSPNIQTVRNLLEIKVEGRTVVLCHYPLLVWNKSHHHSYHLHGHCHGTLREYHPRRVDIGVDCWRFKLVDFTGIVNEIDRRLSSARIRISQEDATINGNAREF